MLTIRHIHKWRGEAVSGTPRVAPRPAPPEVVAARLATCFNKCGRTSKQLCVLFCCGSPKLETVAGWSFHKCGKGFWKDDAGGGAVKNL